MRPTTLSGIAATETVISMDTKRTRSEWIGGVISVPAYVCDDGAPYRPEVLFWLDAKGAVLSSQVSKPGTLLALAAESLRSTIERPQFGSAHEPACVRVASLELASLLRAAFPAIEFVYAPTPELDALLALMRERFDVDAAHAQSYLAASADPQRMAAFFQAAAGLFRAAPWQSVPSDQNLFFVTIAELGLHDAVLSVIGRMGQSVGLIVFANQHDFDAYLAAGAALARGERPVMPRHFALNFEKGAELSPTLRKEIASHHWEVANADAYPSLMAMDEDLVARPPTAAEVTLAELLARALPALIADTRPALIAAWKGGAPASRTLQVSAHAGHYAVTLVAADKREPRLGRALFDVRGKFAELAKAAENQSAPVLSE
jgi:uncharacterized tellurite resistance protein B-like protein